MKVLRYLWMSGRLLFYIAFSAVISLLMSLILWNSGGVLLFVKLFALALPIILLLRFADDFFDYEKDKEKKEQPLSRRGILIIMLIVGAIFIILNVLFYSLLGLCSIFILAYILVQQKAEFLKIFFMTLASAHYFCFNRTDDMPILPICIFLAVCLILSAAFYFFKMKRAK